MWRFGLRTRTAASYVVVTVAAVLIVEAILLGLIVSSASGSDLAERLQAQAGRDAKIISVTAAKMYAGEEPGDQRNMLAMAMKASTSETGFGSYAQASEKGLGTPAGTATEKVTGVPVELLLDSGGRIIASTAPGTYPPETLLKVRLPAGVEGSGGKGTPKGAAWWISPILAPTAYGSPPPKGGKIPTGDPSTLGKRSSSALRTVGYVYVQARGQGTVSFADSVVPQLAPGVLVLVLAVPVGVVFGMLSTRRLISRITRLAEVTTAVADGDFKPRVAVSGNDEVSRLEEGFNRMTEQLGAAVAAERLTAQADARQAERSRIARELHDSISQDLFSLSLLAAGMRRAAPDQLRREAETMERTAARTMREMQALLLELRPVALEDAGLIPALEELCHAYEARLGITVRTHLEDVSLAPAAEHAVLRLTQEALGNAIKHAEPGVIDVQLRRTGREVYVRIADDGRGFDPSCAPLSHGMGLGLMRERIEELGGHFRLTSEPGGGTVVTASLPAWSPPVSPLVQIAKPQPSARLLLPSAATEAARPVEAT
ncbi:hypothetical protein GCM10022226_13100 [Sphaerisporangium flaviroseum]|uniref:Oxygen sensor histidine kinase NreB n=1 Tax=Sphaerisporangium flaviroseum TaxID=509199 RepID=A0ABP7HKC3_9ACTN